MIRNSVKPDNYKQKIELKRPFIIVGIIVIFFIIITAFTVYNRINNASLTLVVAPKSATITIDGNSGFHNETYKIPSGKHTITISKDKFQTITEEITINPGEDYYYYNLLVYPDGSMDWYAEHEDDSRLLETILPEISLKQYEAIKDKNPLIRQLPINVDEYTTSSITKYSISYKINLDDSVTILITDYSGNNQARAYEKIKSLGFNPDDYYILYEDVSEPDGWAKAYDD